VICPLYLVALESEKSINFSHDGVWIPIEVLMEVK